ncbi:S41 family peptidase [Sphingomonas sp. CLY1604]|uniref:S41 family peptidase n=1 Tax=Sphingomonas sp. CLY1604 TaxID=3457786 RepID=UPI003FD75020
MSALLAGCGGDGGGGGGSGSTAASGGTVTTAGCSLRERQDWVNAQMREWYLFPDTLPASLDPANYGTVPDYLNALTATARGQGKDRYFTYLTSIKSENAFYGSGSSAGFGWRLAIDGSGRLQVTEAFEGAPALAAGIDRGAEILAIGTTTGNLQTVSSLYAAGGSALSDALGANTAGTARVFQIRDGSGTRNVSVAKADFTLAPVSSRYGAQIITDGGQRYGYVNLRTFIDTADPALRAAFAQFQSAGVTNVVVDLRYNGGGLVTIAELMSNLLGANRQTSEVMTYTTFRSDKAARNTTTYFNPQPQSVAAMRIAFIGTGATASASEYVINAFIPYLHANAGLIGSNTYGKPVGQIALDKSECDDRLRVIAFALQNAARQGAYYSGLAGTVEASCRAADDINYPMGDPREASTRAALDFLQGKSCTPIGGSATASAEARALSVPVSREALQPDPAKMSPAQREVPGLF